MRQTGTLITLSFNIAGSLSVDKHLKIVRQATWDMRAKWYNLGLELGINDGTLQVCVTITKYTGILPS